MDNQDNFTSSVPVPPTPPIQQTPAPSPMSDKSQNTGMAILAYIGILVIIPLITAKDDPFVKFHVRQGLALLLAWIIGSFIWVIPVLGFLIGWLVWIGGFVLMVIGIMNASSGKTVDLPIVGQFAKNFDF